MWVALSECCPITSFHRCAQSERSAFTPIVAYAIRADDGTSYLLKAALGTTTSSVAYASNSLAAEHALLSLISSQTDVPTPTIHKLDTSGAVVPYSYLLLSHPHGVPLSVARASGKLSERQLALLDLRTGAYLKTLHERVQNDWFGLPSQAHAGLYTWQEAFTPLLESLLDDAERHALGAALPYADLRLRLSRAIGFYLFDDCEVPALVLFTADESSIFVALDPAADPSSDADTDAEVAVTAFASAGHALWGDPLLETLWLAPRAAFVEGYGGPLVVFARQRTKRLWYTLFLALVVLVQARRLGRGDADADAEKVAWARAAAEEAAAALKDAPCY